VDLFLLAQSGITTKEEGQGRKKKTLKRKNGQKAKRRGATVGVPRNCRERWASACSDEQNNGGRKGWKAMLR